MTLILQSFTAVAFGAGLFILATSFGDTQALIVPTAIVFLGVIGATVLLLSIGEKSDFHWKRQH